MARDYVEEMRTLAQEQVSEPVLVAGIMQPAGTLGAMGIERISPLLGTLKRRSANKRSGGMGHDGMFRYRTALLALTAEKLYAFNAKASGRKWKVVDAVGSWDRKDLTVDVQDRRMTKAVTIDNMATGEHFELEAMTMGTRGVNDPLFAELGK
jgi:hypothetical protein